MMRVCRDQVIVSFIDLVYSSLLCIVLTSVFACSTLGPRCLSCYIRIRRSYPKGTPTSVLSWGQVLGVSENFGYLVLESL